MTYLNSKFFIKPQESLVHDMDLRELLNLDKKLIFLENINGDKIGVLNDIHDVVFSPRFNSISTLSFRVYEDECPYYEQITSWRRIQIQDVMKLIIEKPLESNDGLRKYKEITCRSLEIDINRKVVPLLQGTFKFYSPIITDETICSIILSYLPNWTLETVDSQLWNVYRTFDLQNRPLYQMMMEDIENAYECVFLFNTLNKTIQIKAFENIPKKSDIYLSFDNLVNELNITEDTENLITSISVSGANGLDIRTVNPLGDTIYNFQHFATTEYMSEGLVTTINNWQTLINTKQAEYSDYLLQRKTKLAERITLEVELTELEGQLKSLIEVRDALLDSGLNATNANAQVKLKQQEINNKQIEINNKQTEIDNIDLALQDIQTSISLKSYFSPSQLLELEPFIINISVTDENFTKVDTDTDLEIQETAQDLYDKYKRYLDKASKMRYKFSIDLINFISIQEYKLFTQQLDWGVTVNLETESNGIAYPMLLGLDINLDSETDIQFLFGEDLRYEDNAMSYEDYLANQLSNVSNMVTGSSIKWSEYTNSGAKDRVWDLFKNGMNLDLMEIKSAQNQEIIFDSTGLYGRKKTSTGYDDKQWKFINNKLMFTKNGWNSGEMAVGEISLPDGSKSYGISASVILGNLIVGNQLVIANANNTFTVDSQGATLKNSSLTIEKGLNKILLDPTNGFKIQKNVNNVFTDMVYLDTNGNAVFKGNIDASAINGSSFTGGSININNNFTVDSTGNITIKRGSLNIESRFIVENDGTVTIRKGSLDINGIFKVNSDGSIYIQKGAIDLGDKFFADDNNLVLNDAEIQLIGNLGKNKIILNPTIGIKIQRLDNGVFKDSLYVDSNGNVMIDALNKFEIAVNNKFTNYSTTTEMNSAINVSASGIISTVNKTISDETGILEQSISTVDQKANSIQTTVSDHTGQISTIRQTSDAIALAVNNSKLTFNSSGLTISNGGFKILNGSNQLLYVDVSGNLNISGYFSGNGITVNSSGTTLTSGKFFIENGSTTVFTVDSSGYVTSKGLYVGTSSYYNDYTFYVSPSNRSVRIGEQYSNTDYYLFNPSNQYTHYFKGDFYVGGGGNYIIIGSATDYVTILGRRVRWDVNGHLVEY